MFHALTSFLSTNNNRTAAATNNSLSADEHNHQETKSSGQEEERPPEEVQVAQPSLMSFNETEEEQEDSSFSPAPPLPLDETDNTMSTWQDRLKAIIGARGYHDAMRRSLQTIVLYEAKRAVEPRYKQLRPYQRKSAFMDQVNYLLDQLDFLYENQKEEVLWRTMTSRIPLDGTVAWTRLKSITKELKSLSEQIQKFMAPNRTHQEAVDLLVQSLFEGKEGSNKGKTAPWTYEYAHNHCITAFRLYYDGTELDANFPAATLCPDISIPQGNAPNKRAAPNFSSRAAAAAPGAGSIAPRPPVLQPPSVGLPPAGGAKTTGLEEHHHHHDGVGADDPHIDVGALLGEGANKPAEDRRQLLQEVRQHLDILKEFEGVMGIPEEEIAKRKRELFQALPPAPAPQPGNKKSKVGI